MLLVPGVLWPGQTDTLPLIFLLSRWLKRSVIFRDDYSISGESETWNLEVAFTKSVEMCAMENVGGNLGGTESGAQKKSLRSPH